MTISASTPLRVVVLLTSFALALLLLLTGAVVARATDGSSSVVTPQAHHVVAPGDTLWDIAAIYTDPGDDVRDTIHDIRSVNGMTSSVILVDQVLVIPLEF
jgi:LysM repeat protein